MVKNFIEFNRTSNRNVRWWFDIALNPLEFASDIYTLNLIQPLQILVFNRYFYSLDDSSGFIN